MNVEIGTEAAQFPEKECINGIFLAVWIRHVRGFKFGLVIFTLLINIIFTYLKTLYQENWLGSKLVSFKRWWDKLSCREVLSCFIIFIIFEPTLFLYKQYINIHLFVCFKWRVVTLELQLPPHPAARLTQNNKKTKRGDIHRLDFV